MRENRGRYLAVIGGVLGICVSLGFFGMIKGIISINGIIVGYYVKQILWISDPNTILAIDIFSSTALAVIGMISAYKLSKNVRNSAFIIVASGIAGFIFVGLLWIPAGSLLVLGGILLMRDNLRSVPK